MEKHGKKTKQNDIKIFLIVSVVMIFVVWLIYAAYIIIFKAHDSQYQFISLENISCRIPERMWHPDSDDVFISDHMFSIVDDEKEYYIYGSQLEQWDSTDEQLGLLKNYDPVKGINYDTEKDFYDSLKEVSDAVDSVTETGRIRKLSNKMYSISGRGRGSLKIIIHILFHILVMV